MKPSQMPCQEHTLSEWTCKKEVINENSKIKRTIRLNYLHCPHCRTKAQSYIGIDALNYERRLLGLEAIE